MNEQPTYTIKFRPSGDRLEVVIPELDITVWTEPGRTTYDDALDVAEKAIEQWHLEQREKAIAS